MAQNDDEETLLRSVALQNAASIRLARQRAEEELVRAKEALERKTHELAQSLAMMRATLESTTDGILVTDGHGGITGSNEQFVSMWGISPEVMEVKGKNHRHLLEVTSRYFEDPRQFLARIDDIYASSPPASYDLLELADGRVFERCSRVQVVEKQNVGRVWSFRDITKRRRAEQALAKQAEWLRVTLASIGDAVITTDTQGRITYLNGVAESLTGWTQSDAAGQPMETVFRIVNESTGQPVEDPATRALREGVIVGLANHTILIAKDGTERPIDDSAAPMRDEQGHIAGVVLVFRDVTAQRRAERELRQRADLSAFEAEIGAVLTQSDSVEEMLSRCMHIMVERLDGAVARVWTLNEKEGVLQMTACAGLDTRLDGPHSRVAVGQCKIGLIAEQRRPILTNGAVGDACSHDEEWVARDAMVAFAGYPLLVDAKLVGVVALCARHRLSEATLQAIGLVAGSIALAIQHKQQAKNLRTLAADLSEADRRKNEFLAMLAHELRNPLAPIRNALRIMRMAGGDAKAAASTSEMLERQVGHMVRLVDDLLDVSRISRGQIELRKERVELASVVRDAVEATRPLCDSMHHELTVTLPPQPMYLDGDPIRLAQVVGNLLNNAYKYTEKGGRIRLVVEREADQAIIHVRDSGIGIAADQLPRIFDMFMQVDTSLERSVSGLGIGLTLVERLVAMHDGTVEVHSAGVGEGSEFVVRLPIVRETSAPASPEATVTEAIATAHRILVVDDNQDSAESLAMLLELSGNESQTAYDGVEAVEAAATFRPDVVLLDIGLPKMNGYEACRRIREASWGKNIVLIALTGWGQEEDRQKSREAGFNGHFVKPVDIGALSKLLAELPVTESVS